MNRKTMTVTEAAKKLGIGRNQAYAAAKTGKIPVIKVGKRLIVPSDALNKMLAAVPQVNAIQTSIARQQNSAEINRIAKRIDSLTLKLKNEKRIFQALMERHKRERHN